MIFLPYQEIFLWALALSFLISLVYRIFTKPHEMRQIKQDMKLYREKSKEAQKNKDLKKANDHMSEMMKLSQKQMRHTMKPMFITLGIVLILLGYVNTTYSGVKVETSSADGKTGFGHFSYGGFNHSVMVEKAGENDFKVIIDANDNGIFTDDKAYSRADVANVGGVNWGIDPQSLNVTEMQTAVRMPFAVPVFGWTYLTWLMWYILISLPTTWIFRKALGVE
jgi:uncharacterized membrane protein (DUF106 family)